MVVAADPYRLMLKPMLAELGREPFDSPDHFFEVKWDGTRALCFVRGGVHRFQNRRLSDITKRYPELVVRTTRDAILDGEIVVMNGGIPSFQKLQEREHTGDALRIEYLAKRIPATYVVFDVLYIEGREVMSRPLVERKALLRETLVESDRVVLSEHVERTGVAFFHAVVDRGLEGILAKRRTSRYRLGKRSKDWIKIKKSQAQDCVIAGVSEGTGERATTFGALILGAYHEGELVYLGRAGTGFDEPTRAHILERLKPLATPSCPFREVPEMEIPVAFWTEPRLVCEVRFLEFSHERHFRAPTFGRMRDDKAPRDCVVVFERPRKG
ncbi:MAG: non-homologous end-joining DNA ligase [Methanobacteriota archaeon]